MSTTTSSIVFGVVAANGTILAGSGNFSAQTTSQGVFSIGFPNVFSSTPAVVASQGGNFPQPNNQDGAAVGLLSSTGCTIITGDNKGNFANRQFSFVAIGAPATD
ncbi:MAG TPA: hypothetical protein VN493_16065 [Thermoanaerobaculia bacterium]|nr:hypothetical protein [Thermoanaerobaculia bacterium]